MGGQEEQQRGFSIKKKVDESWKDAVEKEKDEVPPANPEDLTPPEPNFTFFISTLGMQALLALGEVPHPVTSEKNTDLTSAKYLIDVIHMLAEKTQTNLSADEDAMLKGMLYELQMKFIKKTELSAGGLKP